MKERRSNPRAGILMKPDVSRPRRPSKKYLREWVLEEIRETGFEENSGLILADESITKEEIRQLHARQRKENLQREERFLHTWQGALLEHFANGREVAPSLITPRVVRVTTEEQAALFRFATLHWSVPVSRGFGRRTRFLWVDEHNDKLIGVFALGDPVYNLAARDARIDWDVAQRSKRLYNVLDAFVLGALPPYRQLLGAKLVAMAAVSDTTREIVQRKYEGLRTKIARKVKPSRPVLVTTTSALGRSSIYNRLKYDGRLLYESVGYTKGFGHFQFSEELFRALAAYLERSDAAQGYKFGQGPNWRIRTLRSALSKLGLNPDLIRHGIRREIFLAPLAQRWDSYLRGEIDRPGWYRNNMDDMGSFFRERWAEPRARWDKSFREVRRADLALILK